MKMKETLYDRIFDKVRYYLTDSEIDEVVDISKACERFAIHAQIDTIKNIFKKYNDNLRTTLSEGGFVQSLDSIALEEIKQLEKQLEL